MIQLKSRLVVLLVMLMPVCLYAASENVTMSVGETKTLYLPSSISSLTLTSSNFYSNGSSYVQVVSNTTYSVTVKAVKAFSSPVVVRCDYYYYVLNGGSTYQASGAYDFNVTVTGEAKVEPTSISLPSIMSVPVGGSGSITPTVLPANAEYTLTWTTVNHSIAIVNSEGIVTGVSRGETDLKVTTENGLYAMCRIVVYNQPASIELDAHSKMMEVGTSLTMTPTVLPSNSNYTLNWTSDDTTIATVTQDGRVHAEGIGTTIIRISTNNGLSDECAITVVSAIYTLNLERELATFSHLKAVDFSNISQVKAYVASEYNEANATVHFESVEQVTGKTGLLLVGTPGTYTIPIIDEAPSPSQNYLKPAFVQTRIVPTEDSSLFVLTNGSHGVGFYIVSEEGVVPVNKAYLQLPKIVGTRELGMVFDDQVTSVHNAMSQVENDEWYTLNGMKLIGVPSCKGVYLHHQKKYVVK